MEMRYSTILGSPKFPAAINAVIPQSSAAFAFAPKATSSLMTSNRSALDFPLLYPSIQAYPAACMSGVSLWLDTMLGSAPYDNNSRTSSISAENAARASEVANVVRGVKFRAERRDVGMLFTNAFGSAPLARSFWMRGIGSCSPSTVYRDWFPYSCDPPPRIVP